MSVTRPPYNRAHYGLQTRKNLVLQLYVPRCAVQPLDGRARLGSDQQLQDQVAPIAFAEVKAIVEAELKRPLAEAFSSIDQSPLAAASIAQVHAARLHSGEAVVVKVQRPGIQKVIEVDLEIMQHLASLMEHHLEGWAVHRPRQPAPSRSEPADALQAPSHRR